MTRILLLAAVLMTSTAAAQVWEQIPPPSNYGGPIVHVDDIAFLPGPSAEGSLVMVGQRTLLYDPDRATEPHLYPWVNIEHHNAGPRYVTVTTAGTLLAGAPAGTSQLERSTDRGQTWQDDVAGSAVTAIFQTSLPALVGPEDHGAIFVSTGRSAVRSFGDGAPGTWQTLGVMGGETVAFGEVPPSDALPDGRLLAGLYNGVVYSDDGGATWQAGVGAYGFARYIGHGFAFVPEPGHAYGGAVLAGINDLALDRDSSATVYRSEDGGATWARGHRFSPAALGLPSTGFAVLTITPDGVVWAAVSKDYGPSQWNEGAVVKSLDGGATWQAGGYVGTYVSQLVVGPDRRLYAATYGDGVWRTTAPVFAVAGEDSPVVPSTSLGVSVFPNPTGGPITVSVTLAAPERMEITVLDVRGRVVQQIHRGPASDGQRFAVETAGLAPGAYVVRVTSASGAATAGLTVAR